MDLVPSELLRRLARAHASFLPRCAPQSLVPIDLSVGLQLVLGSDRVSSLGVPLTALELCLRDHTGPRRLYLELGSAELLALVGALEAAHKASEARDGLPMAFAAALSCFRALPTHSLVYLVKSLCRATISRLPGL